AIASCINNQEYEVSLSFSGTGSQFEVSVLGGMKLDTLSAGTYVFGPFASNQPIQLVVTDLSNVNCADTTAVLVADCNALCDVDITNAVATCIDNVSYQVALSFTGTGNQFEISLLGGAKLDTLAAGTHVFGPFNSNQPVQLVVKDLANIDCADTTALLVADCSALCDVAIDTFYAACFPNISITSFKAFVVISGSTGPYRTRVLDVASQVLKDTTLVSGLHDLGFYANSTLLQVSVEDPDDVTCSALSPFVTADCTPVVDCDSLQIGMVTATCISNDSFEVVVSFLGQVNQPYRIQALQNSTAATITLNNLSPGTYSLGNFATDYAVNVFVAAENQVTCVKMASPVVQNCAGAFPPSNDLCSNAQPLSCGQSIQGSFDGASNTGVPSGSCGRINPRGVGVWYSFQGDGRIITLSTCNTVPAFNTQIFVYSGSCGSLTCEAGNNNGTGCFAGTSELTFISTSGETYYIYVTDASLTGGNFTLDISCRRGFIFSLNLFRPIRNGFSNQLSWNMVESTDVLGYEVERKEYGGEYEPINFVPAKGGMNLSMDYTYEDTQLEEWKVYTYRIRAVFGQNADVVSEEQKLLVEQLGQVMLGDLYPNPAEGRVNLPVSSIREQLCEWQVYDMQGRLLSREEVPLVAGEQTLRINLVGLPQGVFRVLFLAPETLIAKTLLVE
ncbi:MAG: T9SS type A sorting domain-containing protein, partial [Bacteroidota bacterium]